MYILPDMQTAAFALLSRKDKFVISGDVLFAGSIGRTDLPTGNFETLAKSIKEKLYTLDDDFTVYPGHGPYNYYMAKRNTQTLL